MQFGRKSWLVVAALFAIGGCAARAPSPRVDPVAGLRDIHDRIAVISSRNGFHNGIHTWKQDGKDLVYTFVHFSLDGLKTRHESLTNLIKGIGQVCAATEFANLPIHIEIRAHDEADLDYLKGAFARAVAHRPNVVLSLHQATYSGIIVAVAGNP